MSKHQVIYLANKCNEINSFMKSDVYFCASEEDLKKMIKEGLNVTSIETFEEQYFDHPTEKWLENGFVLKKRIYQESKNISFSFKKYIRDQDSLVRNLKLN